MLKTQLINLLRTRSNESVMIALQQSRQLSDYHSAVIPQKYLKFRKATLDEFPVPYGSWKESYDKYQTKYHTQLGLALVFYAITIYSLLTCKKIDFVTRPPMKNPK